MIYLEEDLLSLTTSAQENFTRTGFNRIKETNCLKITNIASNVASTEL